nr:type I restriction enzyme endonuclease domain-containing protein [Frankia sp. ACN10a]
MISSQVIAALVELAKAIQEQRKRGEDTGLSENELAFYDALANNESARDVMQDETMRKIAHEPTGIVRRDAKTDWQVKASVRAKLRTSVKHLLLLTGTHSTRNPARPS